LDLTSHPGKEKEEGPLEGHQKNVSVRLLGLRSGGGGASGGASTVDGLSDAKIADSQGKQKDTTHGILQGKGRGNPVAPEAKPHACISGGQMVTDLIAVAASLLVGFPASSCSQGCKL
jgi:hypothetical protein